MWIEITTKETSVLIPLESILKLELTVSEDGKEAGLYIYGKDLECQVWGTTNSVKEAYKAIRQALIEGRKEGFISVFIETPDTGEAIPV